MLDGETPIANGYSLSDSGGAGRVIVVRGNGRKFEGIVVDFRVDAYVLDGDRLVVARRPAYTVPLSNGSLELKLDPNVNTG